MHRIPTAWIVLWLCILACPGCAGKPIVHGWLDSEGTIYRRSEQDDFGSRTTIRMRGMEF
jgi:hypothetical protein